MGYYSNRRATRRYTADVTRPTDFKVLSQDTEVSGDTATATIRGGTIGSGVFVNGVDSEVDVASKDTELTLDTSGDAGEKLFDVKLEDTAGNSSNPVLIKVTKADAAPVYVSEALEELAVLGGTGTGTITLDKAFTSYETALFISDNDGLPCGGSIVITGEGTDTIGIDFTANCTDTTVKIRLTGVKGAGTLSGTVESTAYFLF